MIMGNDAHAKAVIAQYQRDADAFHLARLAARAERIRVQRTRPSRQEYLVSLRIRRLLIAVVR